MFIIEVFVFLACVFFAVAALSAAGCVYCYIMYKREKKKEKTRKLVKRLVTAEICEIRLREMGVIK